MLRGSRKRIRCRCLRRTVRWLAGPLLLRVLLWLVGHLLVRVLLLRLRLLPVLWRLLLLLRLWRAGVGWLTGNGLRWRLLRLLLLS